MIVNGVEVKVLDQFGNQWVCFGGTRSPILSISSGGERERERESCFMGEGSAESGLKSKKKAGVRLCYICNVARAALQRPKTQQQICKECFYSAFEEEIHNVIVDNQLFKAGEHVAIAASGSKDSTVLAYVLSTLNHRHNYGLDMFLLSIDEGITGYRDDSLETVKRNEVQYGLPLKVLSYKTLYGWTMDEIVKEIGLKNNCTFCGVFRRQKLCKACVLLDGLNRGLPKLGIARNRGLNNSQREKEQTLETDKENSFQSKPCGSLDF